MDEVFSFFAIVVIGFIFSLTPIPHLPLIAVNFLLGRSDDSIWIRILSVIFSLPIIGISLIFISSAFDKSIVHGFIFIAILYWPVLWSAFFAEKGKDAQSEKLTKAD